MKTTSTSSVAARRFVTYRRLIISLGTITLAIALFGLLGYYWLPDYAKSRLEAVLSETFNRPVTIQAIEIQPYSLELTIRDFRIAEKADTQTDDLLFSFDRLHVDLSIESIRHLAPVATTVVITAPRLRLVREDKHRFNISDLIEKFKTPDDQPDDAQAGLPFSVSNIHIQDGSIHFDDQLKRSHQKIDQINLTIPFIANFESAQIHWVEPYLSANINGAPLVLEGKLRPFADKREATLLLKFSDIDLTNIDEYSPIPIDIRLLSGNLDSNLSLVFTQAVDEAPSVSLSGGAALKELTIENRGAQAPYQLTLKRLDVALQEAVMTELKPVQLEMTLVDAAVTHLAETEPVILLPKLHLDTINIDRAHRHIALGTAVLDGARTLIRRQTDGQLDLAQLFAPIAASEDNPAETISSTGTASAQVSKAVIPPIPRKKPTPRVDAPSRPENVIALPAQMTAPIPDRKPVYPTKPGMAETATDQGEAAAESGIKPEHVSKPWTTQINQLQLNDASARFEDHTLAKIVPLNIESLNLMIHNIDLSGAKPLDWVLQATINQRGSIESKGTLTWAPLATDLSFNLQHLDLVPLQGWVSERFHALLSQGHFSFQGHAKAAGEPLKITLNGKGLLANFNILDRVKGTRLLRWKRIDLTGVQFINDPLRVDIAAIDLDDFYARVTLLPSKELNLHRLVQQEASTATAATNSTNTIIQPGAVRPVTHASLPVYIDKVVLRNGYINFTDQFIKPNYRANLSGLKGQIGPLHPGKSGKIDVRGSFDKSAPLQIYGMIDPFSGQLFLDIVSTVTGIDLPTFSPYSGKYIGYVIDKGKLSFDVNYHVEQGELKAKNNIFLDQLELGDKTESSDAVSLPLHLAISLLKNRRGEIDIRLPVSGSINDPKFSLTGIIWEAFVNLITKAITAPFTLLASLVGEGEELSEISFPAGYATLDAEAEKRLQALSAALLDRPALKLELTGFADPVNDHDALKRALLERNIKTQKLSESVKKGQTIASLDQIQLDDKEYLHHLTRIYKEADFEKPKNIIGLTKSLPAAEMEQLILAHTTISEDELHELAEHRASAVLHWLIEQGGIPGERVFVLGTKVASTHADQQPNSRVEFSVQ